MPKFGLDQPTSRSEGHHVNHYSTEVGKLLQSLPMYKFFFSSQISASHSQPMLSVRSESEFKFLQRDQDVIGMEKVHFQCPAIMSAFCHREVLFQRQEIFDNLKKMFSNKVIAVQDTDFIFRKSMTSYLHKKTFKNLAQPLYPIVVTSVTTL